MLRAVSQRVELAHIAANERQPITPNVLTRTPFCSTTRPHIRATITSVLILSDRLHTQPRLRVAFV